ncbi:MAG: polyprenyl synthetase family protein [Deltaproteobacteria bacterium]|jgi:octaprenyl-diphosphate synthase|nr:polyprenyl synthetase family protein [Deltaproteobacteria bacterium]
MQGITIPIRKDLDRLEEFFSSALGSGVDFADSAIELIIQNGGKRIRPVIFLLSAHLCGSSSSDNYRTAAAIEMIHAASLLHDDVLDDASIRRGSMVVRKRFGNRTSIVVGDYLWSKGISLIIRENNIDLLNASSCAVERLVAGQLLEMSNCNKVDMEVETYMKVVEKKTASLFAMSAEMGAIVGGIQGSHREVLYKYGTEIGIAYQLCDDLLDYIGGESTLGKSSGQDLRRGIMTYPLIVTLERANRCERDIIIEGFLSECPPDDMFRNICSIMDRYGGIAATRELISKTCFSAKEMIEKFKPSIERDALASLADLVMDSIQ